ncbi:hypothetical protein BN14_09415 [Rhizoctonia solani AG-1 IB]|uniref:Nephrocystin 3-like N-terminal domain-containing protein n=1 Tax=Thanatephorus cucumeris (strain AG1-IB / isolate 7/3/14) TaxID=1108050 RepID=M5C5P4_THACB|nr:hypothetical protein BN14_09415 [Rhizoctonia solani AG-1 IB]
MSPSRSAMYNSAESCDIKRGVCAPGTRKAQIDQLLEWAHDPETGQTCWMNGMAGTGKTTIAYSVCERLDEAYELGASFFCSRTMPECRQVKYIIPTIAYQLARFSVPFRNALYAALESDPDAHARTPKLQYEKLVVGPLSEVRESLPANFIVVIDALDECESEDAAVGQRERSLIEWRSVKIEKTMCDSYYMTWTRMRSGWTSKYTCVISCDTFR